MILFNKNIKSEPQKELIKLYHIATKKNQRNIEAASLSTISSDNKPHCRFINIKYVNENEFIFFSNYNSSKARDINLNKNIALTFFWNLANIQIRIEGEIKKLDEKRSDIHWLTRSVEKNALAFSSDQSKEIASFKEVKRNYNNVLKNEDLTKRPKYWGGYVVVPHYFEFWEGSDFRLNKRKVFFNENEVWNKKLIQP
tara:strand:+ start:268 stop:861 length:594 start_codon:yes stop_codon:yes gene_type:complete